MLSTGSVRHPAAGFTLLELMVVLAILGLVLAIVPASLMNATGAHALKADVRTLISGLHYARTRAIASNAPVVLSIDPQTARLSIDGTQQIGVLSSTTSLGALNQPIAVQFYPDGGSSGGEVLLSSEQGEYRVTVHWLTGAVSATRE